MSGFIGMNQWEANRNHILRLMDKSVKGNTTDAEEQELWEELMINDELFDRYVIEISTAKVVRELRISPN